MPAPVYARTLSCRVCIAPHAYAAARPHPGLTRASSSKPPAGRKTQTAAAKPKAKAQLAKPRLDYARLLADADATAANIAARALPLPLGARGHVDALADARRRQLACERALNAARAEHGRASDAIRAKGVSKEDKDVLVATARGLKEQVSVLEREHDAAEIELLDLALAVPNFSVPGVPVGAEENAVTLETFGPAPLAATDARDHVAIAERFGWIDSSASAIATGASWPYLIGALQHLEHALVSYALATAVRRGYTPVSPPDVVNADVAWRCGFQPRDGADGPRQTYFLQDCDETSHAHNTPAQTHLCLAGTAEIPLAALWANRVLPADSLPARVVGVGRAFRAEAGARGADTRGLYRVHQFTKVELFVVAPEDSSETIMEEMRAIQRQIAEGLGLSVRVLDMPTEELGASAARKYDMEAWMPGRARWGEITSTSNCTDYQARRLHIRYRDSDAASASASGKTPAETKPAIKFAHTLNGTAAAVPRLIVALLENGARFEGGELVGVDLPEVLRRWWVGPEADEEGVIRWV